jgi:aminoglycoside 6'-N-acetyltransferase
MLDNLHFYPLTHSDLSLLLNWLNKPHLKATWGESKQWSMGDIQDKYASYLYRYKINHEGQKRPLHAYIIQLDNRSIGYIQFYDAFDFPRQGYTLEEQLPSSFLKKSNKNLTALDIFIGEKEFIGKGYGPHILEVFCKKFIFDSFEACMVDPDLNNSQAIKAYKKAGFQLLTVINNETALLIKRKID